MNLVDNDSQPVPPEPADIETSSDDYATRFSGRVGAWMLKVQEELVLDMLHECSPESILDVGGGHGQLAFPLVEAGYRITVLGSAPSCSKRIQPLIDAGTCTFDTGNVLQLPYADNSFDVVTCIRLVTHCKHWPILLKELTRVARKAVILDYPTSQSINKVAPAFFKAKKKVERNTRTWINFKHSQILETLKSCDFHPTHIKKEFFLPMALHRMIKCKGCSAALEKVFRLLGCTAWLGSPVLVRADRKSDTTAA